MTKLVELFTCHQLRPALYNSIGCVLVCMEENSRHPVGNSYENEFVGSTLWNLQFEFFVLSGKIIISLLLFDWNTYTFAQRWTNKYI